VHIARHQWPQAATLFEALLKRHADINLAYNLAYAYQWQGRHADAYQVMAAYSEAPELTPAMVTLLVRTLHHLGEGERAIALAHAQMARCQGDPVFLAAASLAMLDSGDLAEAERLSATALALGAQQGQGRLPLEALVVGGSVALGRAEGAAATAYFQQVLEQNPREGVAGLAWARPACCCVTCRPRSSSSSRPSR
jgi:tetratricopeptide (TPR) repeat protein